MKTTIENPKRMVSIPESVLLSLVASKLKGRVLFPNAVEDTKRLVKNMVLQLT